MRETRLGTGLVASNDLSTSLYNFAPFALPASAIQSLFITLS